VELLRFLSPETSRDLYPKYIKGIMARKIKKGLIIFFWTSLGGYIRIYLMNLEFIEAILTNLIKKMRISTLKI